MVKFRVGDRVRIEARVVRHSDGNPLVGAVSVRVDEATDPGRLLDGVDLELPAVLVHRDLDRDLLEDRLEAVIREGLLFDAVTDWENND